jgi:hypothetical protein
LILIAATSGSVARSQDVLSDTDHEDDVVSLLQSAMRSRVALGHDRKGNTVLVHHCSHAAEGCERRLAEFARYLVDAGQAYGIDPWLMAAMAFKESGLNPFAQGAKGELGILQIHPKRRDARQVRFIRDGWYRMRCHKEAGACQREVVRHAAHVLARSIELCGGDVKNALGLYNTGRCGGNHGYAKSVLFELGQLRRVVGLEVQAARAQERS